MTLITPDEFGPLLAQANLAPSVHNTQPTRWRLRPDGTVLVLEDVSRTLTVGDPQGRDAAVSHGAAIEGLALALSARGQGLGVEALNLAADRGLRPVARLTLLDSAPFDPLQPFLATRRTYRGAFSKAAATGRVSALAGAEDVRLVQSPAGIARLAQLNDAASMKTFRDGPYRAELLSWMRLSRSHPDWARDGLNAEAMEMSGFEAAGAGLVLRPGVFEGLDRLGLAGLFVAETAVVRSAEAIALFHRPPAEPLLETGRRFHRLWLEIAALGLSAAPMAVLADDTETRATIGREFDIPTDRRLITALRIGVAPTRALGPKPRLSPAELGV